MFDKLKQCNDRKVNYKVDLEIIKQLELSHDKFEYLITREIYKGNLDPKSIAEIQTFVERQIDISLKLRNKSVAFGIEETKLYQPPKIAEYLLFLFIPKQNRNAVLGDLEEDYHLAFEKYGLKKAQFFYWWQVVRSIWPLISAVVLKLIKLLYNDIVSKSSIGK